MQSVWRFSRTYMVEFSMYLEKMLRWARVDYTALNLIHNVKQGQEICRLIKPTEGEPGRTVLDTEIPAKSGKSVPLPKGRNTEISEDGTLLVASRRSIRWVFTP